MLPTVTLHPKKERPAKSGHPWVFSGAIRHADPEAAQRTLVRVLGSGGDLIGHGLYSPQSKIRVRLVHTDAAFAQELDAAFFERALMRARQRRVMLGLEDVTDAYRLVNSDGDGLPGLTVDVLGQLVVMQVTTFPMFLRREAIVAGLRAVYPEHALLEIPAPSRMAGFEGFEGRRRWWTDEHPERVVLTEHGVRFTIETENFQKTGHYADMRPHRAWIGQRSRGRRVLDAYAYSGGFGLHAALGGASGVVSVDSSGQAVARITENAELNGVPELVTPVKSKVDDYLRSGFDRGERFDVIVLDPPKLAPNRHAAKKALGVYEAITVQAARILAPGGLLCVTSCSEAIGRVELERVLGRVTQRLGRPFSTVYVGVQGPDHPYPAAMPEGQYATFLGAV